MTQDLTQLDQYGLPLTLKIVSMMPGADDPSTPTGKEVALLRRYVDAGKTGVAAGEGFYKYDANGNVVE